MLSSAIMPLVPKVTDDNSDSDGPGEGRKRKRCAPRSVINKRKRTQRAQASDYGTRIKILLVGVSLLRSMSACKNPWPSAEEKVQLPEVYSTEVNEQAPNFIPPADVEYIQIVSLALFHHTNTY